MNFRRTAEAGMEKLKAKLLKMETKQWMTLLLLGLILAVAAMPVSNGDRKERHAGEETVLGSKKKEEPGGESVLEWKLERLLSGVEGVGEVKAFVMTEEQENAGGFYCAGASKVTGVLVSAEGAGNPVIARKIQEAVQALFQVEAHKIKVMKMAAEVD